MSNVPEIDIPSHFRMYLLTTLSKDNFTQIIYLTPQWLSPNLFLTENNVDTVVTCSEGIMVTGRWIS